MFSGASVLTSGTKEEAHALVGVIVKASQCHIVVDIVVKTSDNDVVKLNLLKIIKT